MGTHGVVNPLPVLSPADRCPLAEAGGERRVPAGAALARSLPCEPASTAPESLLGGQREPSRGPFALPAPGGAAEGVAGRRGQSPAPALLSLPLEKKTPKPRANN